MTPSSPRSCKAWPTWHEYTGKPATGTVQDVDDLWASSRLHLLHRDLWAALHTTLRVNHTYWTRRTPNR